MGSKQMKIVGVVVLLLALIAAGVVWFFYFRATVYSTDTVMSEDFILEVGDRVVLKDGATLTVNGNATIDGDISCKNGPLSLTVTGNLTVSGNVTCERGKDLADDDVGNALLLVVAGSVDFADDSSVTANGHVQLVAEAENLVLSEEGLDALYADIAEDSGDGLRVGPFIPIPLAPGQIAFAPAMIMENTVVSQPDSADRPWMDLLIPAASAQQPAVDTAGNVVPNTVKIGGTWVVGQPHQLPPDFISVDNVPEKIKRVVLNFNFGSNGTVNLSNLTLFGPDGNPGESDSGSCTVKGKTGKDAYRLNVNAGNIRVNNFDLWLGSGGQGGDARTGSDCESANATGGEGGNPGNFKMRASNKFEIVGTFSINPGIGGAGGSAFAYGKVGEDGCAADNGGDATATAGKGGDNKKGAKVSGQVTGVDNVKIGTIFAGPGGHAEANGGSGGEGQGCNCDGGDGGEATATGGNGGAATSRSVESHGGNGGDATATPGMGGPGGDCDATDNGGDGGNGGDAVVQEGKAGTGKTKPGRDGQVKEDNGGDGGPGGDGCDEGYGGIGGSGDPDGNDGSDGQNLCKGDPPKTNVTTGGGITATPKTVKKKHVIGVTKCPQDLGEVLVNAPEGMAWEIETEMVSLSLTGTTGLGTVSVPLKFNCNINDYSSHTEEGTMTIKPLDDSGEFIVDSFFDVFVEIEINSGN